MTKLRTFRELDKIKSFEERFNYLKLEGSVGKTTFGFDRYLNQAFYTSKQWLRARDIVIVRDNGYDLGLEDYPIFGRITIHHMNPITIEDFEKQNDIILDPEYLICVSYKTHLAIHYGDINLLAQKPIVRKPGDTSPWLKETSMAKRKDFPVRESKEEIFVEKQKVPSIYLVSGCNQVNVRSSPNRKASVLFIAMKGTPFIAEEAINGWFKVEEPEGLYRKGYILSDFLKEKTNE